MVPSGSEIVVHFLLLTIAKRQTKEAERARRIAQDHIRMVFRWYTND